MLDLYDDFHLTVMELQDEEVRGPPALKAFAGKLRQEKTLPSL